MIPRYSRAAMAAIWTEEAKLARWLEVELAVCRAWGARGVIPPEDFQALRDTGVAAIFTPGATVPDAAIEVMERLNEQMGYAQLESA